jgi:hypothetical protein
MESSAILRGIFIQQCHKTMAWGQKPEGYCVTFPRLVDLPGGPPGWEQVVLTPTKVFSTFGQALDAALLIREAMAPLKRAPVYCLQQGWRKGYRGDRILQLVHR